MTLAWRLRLRDLVQERTGILMRIDDATSVERFVDTRIDALGLRSRMAYVQHLAAEDEEGPEFGRVISVVAIGQTYFFRDQEQFDAISELLTRRAREKGTTLHIWSACCSTGQEAWSLAMLCDRLGISARVLGTDINEQAIAAARAGHYVDWTLRNVPSRMRQLYFTRDGEQYTVNDLVRRRVRFQVHNIVRHPPCRPPGSGGWDLILCRHAMVYFAQPTVEQVARNLAANLAKDGRIFLGASESLHGLEVPLSPERIKKRIAYKASPTSPRVGPQPPERARVAPLPGESHPPPPSTLLGARQLLGGGEVRPALEVLRQLVEAGRDDVEVQLLMGHALLQLHEFPKALDAYVSAQGADPLLPEAHYLQGVVYRKLGDLESAVASLRRCLFLEPSFWPASFLLAGAYDRLGRADDRRRQLAQTLEALEATPSRPLFRVSVDDVPTLRLPRADVERQCRKELDAES